MNLVLSLKELELKDRSRVGGKAMALAQMVQSGMEVPPAVCIPTDVYLQYLHATGLGERIGLELNRKSFEDMRWEEIWDTALRIRNLFLKTPIPGALREPLRLSLGKIFADKFVAVRSSAPGEDAAQTSFAGLHESYIHISGTEAILEHLVLVWASLWSDRALLYRRELGLDVMTSSMAVVIQEMILGEISGIAFGKNPLDETQAVIEAVYGLNPALVDGTVEPDRWILDRKTGMVLAHHAARREQALLPGATGGILSPLSAEQARRPPLDPERIERIFQLVRRAESLFGVPQDLEWTWRKGTLFALQARPITTGAAGASGDQRSWYLSLRRSFENLKRLRDKIEKELIPEMAREAEEWARVKLSSLTDGELANEIERRATILDQWEERYKEFCIPFAHGIRLFGQVYNNAVKPEDPFEFMELLRGTGMVSMQRNREIERLSAKMRRTPGLARMLKTRPEAKWPRPFRRDLDAFLREFGDLTWAGARLAEAKRSFVDFLGRMAGAPRKRLSTRKRIVQLEGLFFSRFEGKMKQEAAELLDLGRASYRLRDDDNLYMGKLRGQLISAVEEGRRRLPKREMAGTGSRDATTVVQALRGISISTPLDKTWVKTKSQTRDGIKPRQLVGQPAGPGLGSGKARVLLGASDLFSFRPGEVLVCDAVDPNMTFVAPLASAIVERRGGMLIHGAIIAREYGLPCVTGVPDATTQISTGDQLTVDGFLGIVTIGKPTLPIDHSQKRRPPKPK